ncbi:MAG: hypothetical protein U0269_18740 [Polyangiales bacterium]
MQTDRAVSEAQPVALPGVHVHGVQSPAPRQAFIAGQDAAT